MITGGNAAEDDPLRRAFIAHGSADGRCSWDPLTVLTAILQDEAKAGYGVVRGYARVDPVTGENNFTADESGPHRFVTQQHSGQWYADRINALLS